jgi:hypothetical protein
MRLLLFSLSAYIYPSSFLPSSPSPYCFEVLLKLIFFHRCSSYQQSAFFLCRDLIHGPANPIGSVSLLFFRRLFLDLSTARWLVEEEEEEEGWRVPSYLRSNCVSPRDKPRLSKRRFSALLTFPSISFSFTFGLELPLLTFQLRISFLGTLEQRPPPT